MGQNGSPLNLSLHEYIAEVSREVEERLNHLGMVVDQIGAERKARGEPIDFCPLVDCRARERYRNVVQEAVRVLDDTRRSFKSRQLEDLRRKLETVLVEDAPSGPGGRRLETGKA